MKVIRFISGNEDFDTSLLHSSSVIIARDDTKITTDLPVLHDNTFITLPTNVKSFMADVYSIWWVMTNFSELNIDADIIVFEQKRRRFLVDDEYFLSDKVYVSESYVLNTTLYHQFAQDKVSGGYLDIMMDFWQRECPEIDFNSTLYGNIIIPHSMFAMPINAFLHMRNILLPVMNKFIQFCIDTNIIHDRYMGCTMERVFTIYYLTYISKSKLRHIDISLIKC